MVRKEGGGIDKRQDGLDTFFQRHATSNVLEIIKDTTHPLHKEYDCQQIERSIGTEL